LNSKEIKQQRKQQIIPRKQLVAQKIARKSGPVSAKIGKMKKRRNRGSSSE